MLCKYDINEPTTSRSLLHAPVACRLFLYADELQLNELDNTLLQDFQAFHKVQQNQATEINISSVYDVSCFYIDANHILTEKKIQSDSESLSLYNNTIDIIINKGIKTRALNTKHCIDFLNAKQNLIPWSNLTLEELNLNGLTDKLKVFVAVHNTLTLLGTSSSAINLDTNIISIRQLVQTGAVNLQDLHELYLILWQSLVVNTNADSMHSFLNTSLFNANMKDGFAMFQDTSTFNIETSTSLFTQDKLFANYSSRQPISSARLVKQLYGSSTPYWAKDCEFKTTNEERTLVDTAETSVGNAKFQQTANTLGMYLSALLNMSQEDQITAYPRCLAGSKHGVRNQIALSKSDLLQGQIISYTSTYGSIIDLLFKNFVELQCQQNSQIDTIRQKTISMLNEMPQLIVNAARIIASNCFELKPANYAQSEFIDTSCPGFLFGMNFGKNVIGIHADCIFKTADSLYVGELKTKWTLPDGEIKLGKAILFDHMHQCICQAIVAYCMYSTSKECKLHTELFILSVPFEENVTVVQSQRHTTVLEDKGVAVLACNLYATMLYHFFVNSKTTFSGFTDYAYHIDQKSELLLWVIACMTTKCDLPCFLLRANSATLVSLPQPTLAYIRHKDHTPTLNETSTKTISFTFRSVKYTVLFIQTHQCIVCYTGKYVSLFKASFTDELKKKYKKYKKKIKLQAQGNFFLATFEEDPTTKKVKVPWGLESFILMLSQDTYNFNGVYLVSSEGDFGFSSLIKWFCSQVQETGVFPLSATTLRLKQDSTLTLMHIDSCVEDYVLNTKKTYEFNLSDLVKANILHARWFMAFFAKASQAKMTWLYNRVEHTETLTTKTETILLQPPLKKGKTKGKVNLPTSLLVPLIDTGISSVQYFVFIKGQTQGDLTYTKIKFNANNNFNSIDFGLKPVGKKQTKPSFDIILQSFFPRILRILPGKPERGFVETEKAGEYRVANRTKTTPVINYDPFVDSEFVATNDLLGDEETALIKNVFTFTVWETLKTA